MSNDLEKIAQKRKEWEEGPLKKALSKFPYLSESPTKFYTPLDIKDFDFLDKVGFPGVYPFTAGTYPMEPLPGLSRFAAMAGVLGGAGGGAGTAIAGQTRAALYSGYGTPEDTRDYYKSEQEKGNKAGPNLAMDLPTQCGYDSDNPAVRGEVGKVGVCIDTLRDFEVIYEPFVGEIDLDRIASNFTINGPAGFVIALYAALAEKRGIPLNKLRMTPQNDILKEFESRGTYIFPPKPSMRLFRDSVLFMVKHMPKANVTSIGGYHIREGGATREQDLAYSMANAIAYVQACVDAGLDVDEFAPKITFNAFGGSIELYKEIAFQRAARRMYAKIMKERFGAKDPKSMLIRQPVTAHVGCSSATAQRPLNNLVRSVVGAIAGAMSGGLAAPFPPYDEALGLGWSMEARQLMIDAGRILVCEARVMDISDPFAGSYFMESLTDEIEEAAWKELQKVEDMGGVVAALESGYIQRQIAKSAHERQQRIERAEDLVVGVNCFTGENELEVATTRLVPHPYDPDKRQKAEEMQIANLTEVKRNRDSRHVTQLLNDLKAAAKDESKNLMPIFVECAKAYVSEQEVCDVLRDVFGEFEQVAPF